MPFKTWHSVLYLVFFVFIFNITNLSSYIKIGKSVQFQVGSDVIVILPALVKFVYVEAYIPGSTRMLRHMGMCPPQMAYFFHQKSLDIGHFGQKNF